MPIVIGAKRESNFTDPIGMLGDCHRRIEMFLNVLVRVAETAHALLRCARKLYRIDLGHRDVGGRGDGDCALGLVTAQKRGLAQTMARIDHAQQRIVLADARLAAH